MGSPIIFNGNAAKLLKPNLIIPAPSGTNAMTIATSAMASNLSLTLPGAVKAGVLYSAANGILSMINPGSGAGTTNLFLDNGGFEVDTSGYSAYFNTPGTAPVSGTGGVPSGTTITRTTTNPLFSSGSGLISKDAVNRQGEGISYSVGVPLFMRGKQACLTFDYTVDSGTFVTGDIGMYLVDATNNVVIQPAGFNVVSVVAGSNISQVCNFQIPTTCLSLRVCWHVASTSALAYAIKLDNVILSPQVVSQGSVDSDPQDYTPTVTGLGTGTSTVAYSRWSRDGRFLRLQGRLGISNGTGGGSVAVSLPPGLAIDFSGVSSGTSQFSGSGGWTNCAASSTNSSVRTNAVNGTTNNIYFIRQNGTAEPFLSGSDFGAGTSGALWYDISLPIVGWSSNNATSDQTANQVVMLEVAQGSASGTIAAAFNNVTFNGPVLDTVGGWNGTSYTVKVPGFYYISAHLEITSTSSVAGTTAAANIAKNGVYLKAGVTRTQTAIATSFTLDPAVSGTLYLVAGDVITIQSYGNGTGATLTNSFGGNTVTIFRIAGPNQITAADTVSCSYSNTSLTTFTSSTFTTVPFTSKDHDTSNSYNTTTGVWTCPAPGKYMMSAQAFIGGTWTAGNVAQMAVNKNGTQVRTATMRITSSSPDSQYPIVTAVLNLVAGDTIAFQVNGNGTSMTSFASASLNFMNITRIGAFN